MRKLLFCLLLLMASFIYAQNDNCSGAIPLTVGTDFASGALTSDNTGATTDGTLPACNDEAVENVWFKVVVPQSGNIKIETREAPGSLFDDSVLTVYTGTCSSLTEIACNDDNEVDYFSLITLTGLLPGTTLYVSVWKYDTDTDNGNFQISAYEFTPPTNNDCPGAIPLTLGNDFSSGAITSNNTGATTDSPLPSCNQDAIDNVWFKVVVPPSGNLKLETRQAPGSSFDDSVLSVYSGVCGSLTAIACDEDSGQAFFSLISLTGQTPGAVLYVSVWKYDSTTDNGEFQISAYDSTTLSTQETNADNKKITVHPNPFSDTLTLSEVSDVTSVSITDTSGRLIKTIEKPSSSLHLKDLKEGLYFITLKMEGGNVKTIKTVKK